MTHFASGRVTVRVPASSANLGPGFDSFGLALSLYDVVSAEVVTEQPGVSPVVEVSGEGSGAVLLDEGHLVFRAMVRMFDELGLPTPGVRLVCRNTIPHGRGLGSSSAAIVAGLVLARALVDAGGGPDQDGLFSLAAELEGHPDNVAPAVFGGLTLAWREDSGYRATRLAMQAPVRFLALVPSEPLETKVARGLLPAEVPHADAAHNAGRAGLLVAALTGQLTGQTAGALASALMAATEDRLHEPYRAPAMPESWALTRRLRADGVPAVVSGAGPTVLALLPRTDDGDPEPPQGWRALRLEVDTAGAALVG